MPGVPSGRGCNGCRKQKKKCDQATPKCSRCKRLDLECIGAGVQRFKFKSNNVMQVGPVRSKSRPASDSTTPGLLELVPTPVSPADHLLGQIMYITSATTSLRYNFVYAYGGFLLKIPQHLGINGALDASANAVVSAYTGFCRGEKAVSPRTLLLYSQALAALRHCLDDVETACSTETLSAVMILLICQNFIGTQGKRWTTHCEGTVQILRTRGIVPPRCELEQELLVTLRAPVVFEALFNERIRMTSLEWETLIQNELDDGSLEGQMMHSLSYCPRFIRRGKDVLQNGFFDPTLLTEVDIQYRRMKEIVVAMNVRVLTAEAPAADKIIDMSALDFLHALYQRSYAMSMCVAIILNCTLAALGSTDSEELDKESADFCDEIVRIAHQVQRYRPLGAAYVIICLMAAFAAATDRSMRLQIVNLIHDYHTDFQWSVEAKVFEDLNNVSGRLLICGPESPSMSAMQKWDDLFSIGCS